MRELLNRWRLAMVFSADMLMTIASWAFAFLLCSNFQFPSAQKFTYLPLLMWVQGSAFYFCGLYRGIWRFASLPDLLRILKAAAIGVATIALLCCFSSQLPYALPPIYGMILVLSLAAPRILFRWLKDSQNLFSDGQRVLIVGAGSAGESLVRDLKRVHSHSYQPIAFADDDAAILGKEIHGVRVEGSCQDIPKLVERLEIQLILIAMPSVSSSTMRRIVSLCEKAKVAFRTLPGLKELAEGRVNINALRQVSLEDLLGREQVYLAWDKIHIAVMSKVVLVTGGGGSIGEELCSQLASLAPAKLIIVENSEYNLYLIDRKLRAKFPELTIHSMLCSVTDKEGIRNIFAAHQPELIFHAAAYKHVPLLESQIRIAMYNNIIGTQILAQTAAEFGVRTFVLISTDKAVNPTNIMGTTKRASEIFCQNLNDHSETRFITVRFGNVLESAGSVVPLFRKQLQEGGPLTVTHPDITRFFMTIPEACQLILQAASIGEGGEIFVLDMGEPVKIRYLAEQLIQLSGKNLGHDIEIQYTGLRPGEKLHEELFYQSEELKPTLHPKIRKANASRYDWQALLDLLKQIEQACHAYDESKLLQLLCRLVPEYQQEEKTVPQLIGSE